MAEGDASQNQGNQQPVDQPGEVKPEAGDQKKLERAAKERERRRRRRRKKAELKRLERETLLNQQSFGAEQQKPMETPQSSAQKKPEGEQKSVVPSKPTEETKPVEQSKSPEQPRKRPRKRLPKLDANAQADHPLAHKTHSFTGPLIGGGGEAHELEPFKPQQPIEPERTEQQEPQLPQKEEEPLQKPEEPEMPETKTEAAPPQPVESQYPQPEEPELVQSEPQPRQPEPEEHHEPEPEAPPDNEIVVQHEEPVHVVEMGQIHGNDEIENAHEEESKEIEQEPEPEPQSEPEPEPNQQESQEHEESSKEELSESEGLNHRKTFLQSAGGFSAGVFKTIGTAWHNFRIKFRARTLFLFLFFVILGGALYGAYIYKIPQNIYSSISGFFKPSVTAPPPANIQVDNELLNEWGINTALLFGSNRGSVKDAVETQISNAYYFGYLSELKAVGETGITAAYYYGTGQDIIAQSDEFIGYVQNLQTLANAYSVDVYKMLDQSTDREKALDDYIANLQQILDKSNTLSKQMNLEIDNLQVSYNSLSPNQSQTETDFFNALQNLDGQKSDFLLKSYVDVTQKQVALKAEIDALQKVASYYTSAIQQLTTRLTAVQQNHAVLVQGIHVVDVPGANLNIILPPQ